MKNYFSVFKKNKVLFYTFIGFLQLSVFFWRAQHSYLFSDDFLNFAIFRDMGLTWAYILKDVFGQVVPGHRLINAMVFHYFGVSYLATQIIIFLLSFSCLFLMMRFMRYRCLDARAILFFSILLIFSIPMMSVQWWWSSAMHVLPSLACVLAALNVIEKRKLTTKSTRISLFVGLLYGVGLCFYSKTLYSVVLIGILVFENIYDNSSTVVNSVFLAMKKSILFLMPCFVLAGLYIFVVINLGVVPHSSGDGSLVFMMKYVYLGVMEGTIKGVLGLGGYSYLTPNSPVSNIIGIELVNNIYVKIIFSTVLMFLCCWFVFIGFIRRGFLALFIWLGLMIYLAAAFGTIALMRGEIFGLESALSPRYQADNIYYVLIFLVVMLTGVNGAVSLKFRWAGLIHEGVKLWFFRWSYVLCFLVSMHLLIGAIQVKPIWDYSAVNRYVLNLTMSLSGFPLNAEISIEDGIPPEVIYPGWMAPWNQYRLFLPIFSKGITFRADGSAQYTISDNGKISKVNR